ncbi:hypothetical protein K931_06416 [Aeromonas salmonicida subsp. pectinolytica 34mel]|nr:hypothetical protein K931_06416 [Aeromonas salmonicida subsp. pectinolytica 34mel]
MSASASPNKPGIGTNWQDAWIALN